MLPLDFILFLQIIIFLFITPGTPRIVIVSYSMNYGVQKCVWTALGDITANFIQATLVIFVLGSFFSDNSNFLNIEDVIKNSLIFYYGLFECKPIILPFVKVVKQKFKNRVLSMDDFNYNYDFSKKQNSEKLKEYLLNNKNNEDLFNKF